MVLFTHPCCHDVRAALHLDLAPGGGIAVADVAEELADPGCQVMQLCLGGNLLRDSGAATIAEALKRNASLAALNLEGNGIGAPGATNNSRGAGPRRAARLAIVSGVVWTASATILPHHYLCC